MRGPGLAVWVCVVIGCSGSDAAQEGLDASGDGSGADGATADAPALLPCSNVPATCGPAGMSSCCDNALVPGGTFYRSYDASGDFPYSSMADPATVSDFRLDTYEITVGRFRQFVNAGMGTQASPPAAGAGARTLNGVVGQGGWSSTWNESLAPDTAALMAALKCNATFQTWTDTPSTREASPINCITWYEAFAFCAWDGGFLPTEAEWNYAAAGGNEHRAYPWSQPASSKTIDCTYANHYYNGTDYCADRYTTRVGLYSPKGDGRWGHADLAGNVWEFTLDLSGEYPNPCNDCAELSLDPASSFRTNRGGSALHGFGYLRTGYRGAMSPETRAIDAGARCARLP